MALSLENIMRDLYINLLFPMYPFSAPENIRKPFGFLMFTGVREKVHWEQMD